MCIAVANSLKVGCIRSNKFNVDFSLDVFRYLFNNKGSAVVRGRGKLYKSSDFNEQFPEGWSTLYDNLGDGCTIDFPIIMYPTIKYGPKSYCKKSDGSVVELARKFKEIVCISLLKKRC